MLSLSSLRLSRSFDGYSEGWFFGIARDHARKAIPCVLRSDLRVFTRLVSFFPLLCYAIGCFRGYSARRALANGVEMAGNGPSGHLHFTCLPCF